MTSNDQLDSLDAELSAEASARDGRDRRKSKRTSASRVSADTLALQQSLSIAQASTSRLEQKCLDLLQENLGYKAVIDEQGEASPESQLFQDQMQRLDSVLSDLDDAKSKYVAATTEIADLKHRLRLAEGQAVNGDTQAGIEALASNQERQKYTEQLESDLHDQKALLRHALLSSHALRKENDEIRQGNEYKVVREQLEVVHSTPAEESEQVIAAAATNLTDKIEKSRIATAEGEQVSPVSS